MTAITTSDSFDPRPFARDGAPTAIAGLPGRPALRAFRPAQPVAALGLAVSYLMGKPAFAKLKFGAWSRVLVGQTNRGTYRLVLDDAGRIVGFLGWVVTDEARAEAWLHDRTGPGDTSPSDDDCIVFNAWAADTPQVNRFVLDLAREAMLGLRLIYFKRFYDHGGVRRGCMRVNDFVAGKAGFLSRR